MADLRAKPFYLKQEDEEWVFRTIETMSLEEKLGQLFIDHSEGDYEDSYVENRMKKTMCGGLRYVNLSPKEMREHNLHYQKHAKIPLLIAANTESGGNGAVKGGTQVGCEAKVAAALNHAWYYPILAGRELDSWENLEQFFKLFVQGQFSDSIQKILANVMRRNLGG